MSGQGLLRRFLAAAILTGMAFAAPAQDYGPPLGDLRLSFDPDTAVLGIDVEPFTTFSWYVLTDIDFGSPSANSSNGLLAWEAFVDASPHINITARNLAGNPITCGNGSCGDQWEVFLSQCFFAKNGPFQLVRYDAQLLADHSDLEIRLAPTALSNFGGTAPGWAVCDVNGNPDDFHPFATGWGVSLIVNSSVGRERSSWSSIKARH